MITAFFVTFAALILAELLKGLSANGTPPLLQKYSWQLDLAYFMWTNIRLIRLVLVAALVLIAWNVPPENRTAMLFGGFVFLLLWAFVYWLFNHFWVGKHKFKPLANPTFASAAENKIDPAAQIIGVDHDGVQKAYPVSMIFYHHQIPDKIGDQPIWVTYCGLCRSGRVYDILVDGQALNFGLVGAITFNAVFQDKGTGSWWRQETGEAVKGPLAGKALEDIPMEQMSLKNWLAKFPDSQVLQADPAFQMKYNFITKLMNHEASLPGWHRQETPALVIGVQIDNQPKAYDWNELRKHRMVADTLADQPIVLVSSADGTSPFAYHRVVNGIPLDFEINEDTLIDKNTNSQWSIFGQCIAGDLKGSKMDSVQIYQQFVRAWVSFHPDTTFYDFATQAGDQ